MTSRSETPQSSPPGTQQHASLMSLNRPEERPSESTARNAVPRFDPTSSNSPLNFIIHKEIRCSVLEDSAPPTVSSVENPTK